jgi:CspA family cold shock protein
MQTGKVKHYNNEKGYGFIKSENGEEEFFFHISGLKNWAIGTSPEKDDKVSFKVVDGDRGPKAIEVAKLDEAASEEEVANVTAFPQVEGADDMDMEEAA